jgi:hypothetical protein
MAALVAATHEHRDRNFSPAVFMGGRNKSGHDDEGIVQT